MYCIVCSYAGPIEIREMTKFHCIIRMEKDLIVQGISILGSMDYRPSTLGNHDIPFGVP